MENWKAIKSQYISIIKGKLIPGEYYRAVTCDGDIYDGILTFLNRYKAELQTGNDFRSFNLSSTKLVKYTGQ